MEKFNQYWDQNFKFTFRGNTHFKLERNAYKNGKLKLLGFNH